MRIGPERGRGPLATTLWVLLVVALALAAWRLSSVLLLGFAGVLLAVLFRNLAALIARHTGLPVGAGLALAVIAVTGAFVGLGLIAGPQLAREFGQLVGQAPATIATVEEELRTTTEWGPWVFDQIAGGAEGGGMNLMGTVTGTVVTLLSLATNLVILFTVTLFLAVDPGLYRRGLLHLFPIERRARAGEVLDALGFAIWRWLTGQALAMLVVAVLIFAGLTAIGLPLALVLAAIAGLTNFIPFLGPFLGAVPALLVAIPEGTQALVLTAALFAAVQQLEGNLITPMIQKHATSLPPVLIVLGVAAAGLLFGLPGVFLATPLLLVVLVLVRMLYVEDVLGDTGARGPEHEAIEGGDLPPAHEEGAGAPPRGGT